MIFVSYWFIVFAAVFFVLYLVVRRPELRFLVLLAGSVVFHTHFAGPAGVVPIICLALITYGSALSRVRWLCALAMIVCAAALIFYKYSLFISANLAAALFPALREQILGPLQQTLPSLPPLAISFFVFEFIHYLFEVRRGHPPITNPLHFALFAIFWPSLVAGPIKRYQQFIPELLKGLAFTSGQDVSAGMARVAIGMVKKLIADNITIWVDYHATRLASLDLGWRWVFLAMLALRIYLDFSGYSDMAIGYARMMGIRLPENFNWPYVARSLTEFWERWHISLSTWIRDYIYIPIGGSRHGVPRKVLNALTAFAICGLWHGADWNFLVWGLYHGMGLAVNGNYPRLLGPAGPGVQAILARIPALSIGLTLLFVGFGWLLFFYPLGTAAHMAALMAGR